ncbi:MAG TPA: hypothetical protein VG778_12545 [Blastocatellia bacterium]|nr:hypothetical protein [Blastocatellia bacterium]
MGTPHNRLARAIGLCVCLLLISIAVKAQTPSQRINWNPLLGPSYSDGQVKYTPKYGIRYLANGFDRPKQKRIMAKAPKYLHKKGAGHLVEAFQDFALEMTRDESVIPRWIDEAWEEIRDRWSECGGTFARAARLNPRELTVVIEDRPFWMTGYDFYANGMTDGRIIRVVNITTARLLTNPDGAYLVRFPELMRWEMGNALQVAAFGYPGAVENEIGAASPCGRPIN